MNRSWWLTFMVGAYIGYQMKVAASDDIQNKVAALDGGLMVGSVTFFLYKLVTGALEAKDAQSFEYPASKNS